MLVVGMGQMAWRGALIPVAFRQLPSPDIAITSCARESSVVIAHFRRPTFTAFVLVKHVTFMP
jgi:hypothetical protein